MRKFAAFSLVVMMLVGAILMPASAQPKQNLDACGRPVYNDQAEPIKYVDGCQTLNRGGGGNDRFADPVAVYTIGGSWLEAVSVDDFNGDTVPEMALSTSFYNDPTLDNRVWLIGKNAETTNYNLLWNEQVGQRDPESMDVADIDGNGFLDIVAANAHGYDSSDGDVEIFWGEADFSFTRSDYYVGDTPYGVGVINNLYDHTSLAIVPDWNDSDVWSFKGNGPHSVKQEVLPGWYAGWNAVVTGDVTNDGCSDAVIMWGQYLSPPAFSVYPGDCQGNFSNRIDYPRVNGDLPSAIGIGDTNGDGLQDVIISNGYNRPDSMITVFVQKKNGSLTQEASYPAYDLVESIDLADVNCDGLADIVTTNAGWYAFSWFPRLREGGFGAYNVEYNGFYFSHIGPNGAEMADINGDGLQDYVVVSYNNDGVVLVGYQHPCTQTFRIYLTTVFLNYPKGNSPH